VRANAGTSRRGRSIFPVLCCIFLFISPGCRQQPPAREETGGEAASRATASIDQRSYRLGGIGAFAEMVGVGVKKLALSAAMPAAEMDALIVQAREIAERNGAEVYLEDDFLVTELFPAELTDGMQVLLIYKGPTLQEYMALKDKKRLLVESGEYTSAARAEIAREMGRLLSYPEERIASMLTRQQGEGR